MTTPHPLSDPAVLSEGFHSAFRKGMDSRLASHVHNVIAMVPGDVYGRFIGHVAAHIGEEGALDAGTLREACRSWEPRREYPTVERKRDHARLLHGALGLLQDSDWRSVSEFLSLMDDPFNYDTDAYAARQARDWASLTGKPHRIEPRVEILVRDGGADQAIGRIEPRYALTEPDAAGRRRRVIEGWASAMEGFPPVKGSDGGLFASFDAALEATMAVARGIGARTKDYHLSQMRSGDPEWAARRLPVMERVCRYLATTHEPGRLEGHNIRRALFGPDHALAAYREARGKTDTAPAVHTDLDARPLAHRLEWLLRGLAREWKPDGPSGFLVELALHGEAAALRRAGKAVEGTWFGWFGSPWRSPQAMLDAWNAPDGLPPGPHAIPDVDALPPTP